MLRGRTRSRLSIPSLVALAICLAPAPGVAEATPSPEDWMPLIRSGSHAEAKELCTGWLDDSAPSRRAEAHKCLANVSLSNAEEVRIEQIGPAELQLSDGFSESAVDAALAHLESALELAPQDLSIHQGRLHVLLTARRYEPAVAALRNSIETYRGEDALDAWLAYSQRYYDAARLEEGLAFLRVLEARYPEDHRVAANIGAFLGVLERDEAALRYSRRAVELAPQDPINNWNLGRLYDYTGEVQLADEFYGNALRLSKGAGSGAVDACLYADFVEEKLQDTGRACRMRRDDCPDDLTFKCPSAAGRPDQKPAARDTSQ